MFPYLIIEISGGCTLHQGTKNILSISLQFHINRSSSFRFSRFVSIRPLEIESVLAV